MGVTFGVSAAASNAHHPYRFRDRCRSDWQRLPSRASRGLAATVNQFHLYRADDGRQVPGTRR